VIPPASEAILGIRCGDKKPRVDTLDGMRPTYLDFEKTTKWFLDFWGHSNHFACAQWKFDAKERYEGNFNVKTANPILFLGNTYDPVTPFESAKNMSESFVNGALLHLNGFGVRVPPHPFLLEMGVLTGRHSTSVSLTSPTVSTTQSTTSSSMASTPRRVLSANPTCPSSTRTGRKSSGELLLLG
jgi:hypothetical protein